ncbi:hypothetical protein F4780DRAFT_169743, partial [Xylariomycetidae sp. FL0641]
VRKNQLDQADFPVDNWDLERAKDGLVQYLDFLYTIADIYPLRQHLIDYEAVYELLKLLEGLDVGVEKAPLAGTRRPDAPPTPSTSTSTPQASSSAHPPPPPPPPPPPIADPPHEFPWSGIKGQVLSILAALLQPPPGQSSPGNPAVQLQIVQHNGIVALLNCCLYDDNNRFCRERTQLCLKWLMDGSPDAAAFLQNLVSANTTGGGGGSGAGAAAGNHGRPTNGGASTSTNPNPTSAAVQTIRVDGVPGEVKVQVRSSSAPASEAGVVVGEGSNAAASSSTSANSTAGGGGNAATSLRSRLEENRNRSEELVNDLLALTVGEGAAAARRRIVEEIDEEEDEEEEEEEEDGDETEEEDADAFR